MHGSGIYIIIFKGKIGLTINKTRFSLRSKSFKKIDYDGKICKHEIWKTSGINSSWVWRFIKGMGNWGWKKENRA